MKKIILLLIVFSVIIIAGCMGEDGACGKAYLRIYLGYDVYSYWDNNPGIPYGFTEGHYYQCSAGTYDYSYEDDYYYYYGTYTLTVEPGEEGGPFWEDGADGADSYFTLNCYGRDRQQESEVQHRELTKTKTDPVQGEIFDHIHQEFKEGIYKLVIDMDIIAK